MEDERELIQRVLAGDREAFRPLVEKYQDAVFGVGLSRTGRVEDAQEIAQEAFLEAFACLGRLRDAARFGNWLYGIACNKARMLLRAERSRRLRQRRLADAMAANAGRGDEPEARGEVVREALRRLPEPNRETATLFYINGYSVADVGRFLRRPVGTVKRRLHEARRHLRKELLVMMEDQLKRARPGKTFTDDVLRRVGRPRVWLSGGRHNYLLLTDSQRRCYKAYMGRYEASAVLSRLGEAKGAECLDIYPAMTRLLNQAGYRIKAVTISPSVRPNSNVVLELQREGKTRIVETDFSQRDSIQMAVHTRAEILLDPQQAARWLVRGEGGKPLAPTAAWRVLPKLQGRRYRDIPEVIAELQKNPASERARRALQEAFGKVEMYLVEDAGDGMKHMQAWLKRSRGTDQEAVAAGLLGAFHLHPLHRYAKAVRYLQRAHRLRLTDEAIAFDLATAHMKTGRPGKALELVRRFKLKAAGECNNFVGLWKDRHFLEVVGKIDRAMKSTFRVMTIPSFIHLAEGMDRPVRRLTAAMPGVRKALRRDLRAWLGGEDLVAARRLTLTITERRERGLLWLENRKFVVVPIPDWLDMRHPDLMLAVHGKPCPWRERTAGALDVLRGSRIKVEALVLQRKAEKEIVCDLVGRYGRLRVRTTIDAINGLALAVRARCPVFVAGRLAKKLGRPGKRPR